MMGALTMEDIFTRLDDPAFQTNDPFLHGGDIFNTAVEQQFSAPAYGGVEVVDADLHRGGNPNHFQALTPFLDDSWNPTAVLKTSTDDASVFQTGAAVPGSPKPNTVLANQSASSHMPHLEQWQSSFEPAQGSSTLRPASRTELGFPSVLEDACQSQDRGQLYSGSSAQLDGRRPSENRNGIVCSDWDTATLAQPLRMPAGSSAGSPPPLQQSLSQSRHSAGSAASQPPDSVKRIGLVRSGESTGTKQQAPPHNTGGFPGHAVHPARTQIPPGAASLNASQTETSHDPHHIEIHDEHHHHTYQQSSVPMGLPGGPSGPGASGSDQGVLEDQDLLLSLLQESGLGMFPGLGQTAGEHEPMCGGVLGQGGSTQGHGAEATGPKRSAILNELAGIEEEIRRQCTEQSGGGRTAKAETLSASEQWEIAGGHRAVAFDMVNTQPEQQQQEITRTPAVLKVEDPSGRYEGQHAEDAYGTGDVHPSSTSSGTVAAQNVLSARISTAADKPTDLAQRLASAWRQRKPKPQPSPPLPKAVALRPASMEELLPKQVSDRLALMTQGSLQTTARDGAYLPWGSLPRQVGDGFFGHGRETLPGQAKESTAVALVSGQHIPLLPWQNTGLLGSMDLDSAGAAHALGQRNKAGPGDSQAQEHLRGDGAGPMWVPDLGMSQGFSTGVQRVPSRTDEEEGGRENGIELSGGAHFDDEWRALGVGVSHDTMVLNGRGSRGREDLRSSGSGQETETSRNQRFKIDPDVLPGMGSGRAFSRGASPHSSQSRGSAWLKGLEVQGGLMTSLQHHLNSGGFRNPMFSGHPHSGAPGARLASGAQSGVFSGAPSVSPSRSVSLLGNCEDVRSADSPSATSALIRERLMNLAQAVATYDQPEALRIALLLRQDATPVGTPMQRMAFYLMQALAKRSEGCLGDEYVNEPPQTEQSEALILEFAAQYPPMQFCYTTMACAIHEAIENETRVHIVDFALWAGQWPIVIRQMAANPRGRTRLKFTAIVAPPGHAAGAGPVLAAPALHTELAAVCEGTTVDLQFEVVVSRPEALLPQMLKLEAGEAVVCNFAGRLGTLADSSVLRSSPKDTTLKTVLMLEPRVITVVEWDCNLQQPFFLPRFRGVLDFFAGIFESHESLASRTDYGRRGFEERVLAREMINLVACEGLQRMVRAETLDQLACRMSRVGFAPKTFRGRTKGALRRMLSAYPVGFALVDHEINGCRLEWEGRPILGASSWQPNR